MTHYVYGPGDWTALAYEGRAALLDPTIEPESVTAIWDSMTSGGSLESWLEVLAGKGLASLPSFGLVESGDDGVRVVVRGEVTGLIDHEELSAGQMRTWREQAGPAGAGVVLRVAEGELTYPLVGGMVLAAAVQLGDLPEAPEPDESAVAGAADGSADTDADQPDADAATADEAAADEAAADEDALSDVPEDAPEESVPQEAAPDEVVAVEAEPEEDAPVQADPAPAAAEAAEVQSEAGGAVSEVQQEPASPAAWAAPPAPQAYQWGPPPAAGAVASDDAAQQEAQAPEAGAQLGDHDGFTIRATELPESSPSDVDDATLAPSQEDLGGGVPQQPTTTMQLTLSTGQVVELDRPVLIGRAPESSRFGYGETPRLVTVPSPQQDISRTHVEVKVEGDGVLVTDLRSTNGTVVVMPGAPPRRLHPGESVPVPESTVIDLGDGVTAVVGQGAGTVPAAY